MRSKQHSRRTSAAAAAAALASSLSARQRLEVVLEARAARKTSPSKANDAEPTTPRSRPAGPAAAARRGVSPPSPPLSEAAFPPPPMGPPPSSPGDLPTDVLLAVFQPLPFIDRLAASAVCRRWRDALREPGAGAWPTVVVDASALAEAGRREASERGGRASRGGGPSAPPSDEEEEDGTELESEDGSADEDGGGRPSPGPPPPPFPSHNPASDRPEARVARWIARRASGIGRIVVRARIPRGGGGGGGLAGGGGGSAAEVARADLCRALASVGGAAVAAGIPIELVVRGESPFGGGGRAGPGGGPAAAAPPAAPPPPGGPPPPSRALARGALPALLGPCITSIRLRGVSGPISRAAFAELAALGEPALTDLDIAAAGEEEGEGLVELTPDLGRLTALTRLSLEANDGVDALPAALGALTRLQVLRLAMCPVAVLPPALTACTRLTSLSLTWNSPAAGPALPPDLSALAALRRVDLSDCGLRRTPPALATLPGLNALDLSGNPLAGDWWPASLGRGCASLAVLRVIDAPGVTVLPPHLGASAPLRVLDCSGCRIADLPPSLGRAGRTLEVLRLGGNRLAALPTLLAALPALVEADLSHQRVPFQVEGGGGGGGGGGQAADISLADAVREARRLRRLDLRQGGHGGGGGGGGGERERARGGRGAGAAAQAQPAVPAPPGGWTAASLFRLSEAEAVLEGRAPRPHFLY